jgi:hypothetical protein
MEEGEAKEVQEESEGWGRERRVVSFSIRLDLGSLSTLLHPLMPMSNLPNYQNLVKP